MIASYVAKELLYFSLTPPPHEGAADLLEVEVLGAGVGGWVAEQVQVDVGFELQLTAVRPALKDAGRPGLGVGVEEDQELLVQIPAEEQRVEHLLLPVQTHASLGLP